MPQTLSQLKAHPHYSRLSPVEKLEQMLVFKSFDALLATGEVFDVLAVVDRTGYTRQHIYRLCREGKLECITRGANPEEITYYFLPDQVSALFKNGRK